MKNENNKKIPKSELEYTVKYVFKNDSNVDINKIIKESFLIQINNAKI